MPLDVYRPPNLKCLNCKLPHLSIKQTRGPKSTPRFLDYTWRNMKCDVCKKSFQWGEPTQEGRNHMVMTATPKSNGDGRTENIALALPLGATIKDLKLNKIKVKLTLVRDNYMAGREDRPLSSAERDELMRILEDSKKMYMEEEQL